MQPFEPSSSTYTTLLGTSTAGDEESFLSEERKTNSSSDEEEVVVVRRTNLKKMGSRSSSTSPMDVIQKEVKKLNVLDTSSSDEKVSKALLSVSNHDYEAGFTCPSLSNSPPTGALSPTKTKLSSQTSNGDIRCITRWIDCLMVATFDIELGQKIHQVYPSEYPISQSQLSDIGIVSSI